jgi:hypothetical protein
MLQLWVSAYLDGEQQFLASSDSDQVDATTQYPLHRDRGSSSVVHMLSAW